MKRLLVPLVLFACDLPLPEVQGSAPIADAQADIATPAADAGTTPDAAPTIDAGAPNTAFCAGKNVLLCDDFQTGARSDKWTNAVVDGNGELKVLDNRLFATAPKDDARLEGIERPLGRRHRLTADVRLEQVTAGKNIDPLSLAIRGGGDQRFLRASIKGDDKGNSYRIHGSVNDTAVTHSVKPAVGEWHHVVLDLDVLARTITLTVDGVSTSTGAAQTLNGATSIMFYVGALNLGGPGGITLDNFLAEVEPIAP